jgi:hypothetical protein
MNRSSADVKIQVDRFSRIPTETLQQMNQYRVVWIQHVHNTDTNSPNESQSWNIPKWS